jgi:hypothetical protein
MQYHRFAYSMPVRSGQDPNLSKIRDGAAFGELTAPLARLGYEYGQMIYNPPFNPKANAGIGTEQFHFIKPNHLMVLTTRPPLDDAVHGDKKLVLPSRTHLENQVFMECRKYFAVCSRSHIQLTPAAGSNFEKAELIFHQHKSARLKYYKRLDEFRGRTVSKKANVSLGFFLRTRAIPEYGCGFLASFGMGGLETLIWNRIVRTRFPEWVNRPAFIVAEMNLNAIPTNPMTLEFVDQVKMKVLLEHRID